MVITKKFNTKARNIVRALVLSGLFLLLPSPFQAQDSRKKTDKPAVADSSKEVEKKEPTPPAKPAKKKKTVEEMKIEMLERIADQLSRRMRSIKDREAAITAREKSLSDRETSAREREKEISEIEALLKMREDVIQRREKLPPPQSWKGPKVPSIYGQYAVVLDGKTMQFYHTKAKDRHVPVASTQKLVTALLVCHEGDLDKMVEIPKEVEDVEPTKVGVKPGEHYSRRQLLTSLLVKSGNDIAATLAIDNAGSVAAFAEKMNRFAKYIGMNDSHFVNPHGLPAKGQYSSARDIAIAAFEAYQVPEIRDMVKRKSYVFKFNDGHEKVLPNTNRVLKSWELCNGMKTGFTYAAGNCLVSSAHENGKDRIVVMLKSSRPHVWDDSRSLLEWALKLEMTGPIKE